MAKGVTGSLDSLSDWLKTVKKSPSQMQSTEHTNDPVYTTDKRCKRHEIISERGQGKVVWITTHKVCYVNVNKYPCSCPGLSVTQILYLCMCFG